MVERLRIAIEKARQQRALQEQHALPGHASANRSPVLPALGAGGDWSWIPSIELDPATLLHNRIVTYAPGMPEAVPFDMLRTRLTTSVEGRNVMRIGISSPMASCGKSLVCANLALSIARNADLSVLLLDMDLRHPTLHQLFGVEPSQQMAAYLADGSADAVPPLLRVGERLALGLNTSSQRMAAEILTSRRTAERLGALVAQLRPDFVIFDLPPVLVADDVLAFHSNLDGIALVAGAGRTTARQVEDAIRALPDNSNFLGVILNGVETSAEDYYAY